MVGSRKLTESGPSGVNQPQDDHAPIRAPHKKSLPIMEALVFWERSMNHFLKTGGRLLRGAGGEA